MEESLPASGQEMATTAQLVATWQRSLQTASPDEVSGIAKKAVESLNYQLRAGGQQLDSPVLCWGKGYFEDMTDCQTLTYRDGKGRQFYHGFSEGATVVPIKYLPQYAARLTLVHTVALTEANSINIAGSPKLIGYAHLPLADRNYLPLSDAMTAFESPAYCVNRPGEDLHYLAKKFSADRARGRFASYTPTNLNRHRDEVITRIEAQIGDKGRGLIIKTDHCYVMDTNRNGTTILREDDTLRHRHTPAAFMGVGDFQSFGRSVPRISFQYFDQERHDGLFMALALTDHATQNAGLDRQLLYVPLVGNNFHLELA